jgi:hypothetical protein
MTMENLNNIFDEDLKLDESLEGNNINPEQTPDQDNFFNDLPISEEEGNSLLDTYLRSKGIENSKVTILDDNEDEKEVDFYELSKSEQLDVLNTISQNESETDLDNGEIELINHLRSNNLSVEDFLEGYKQSIIEELGVQPASQNYDIDAYDDQELFLLDLKNKYNLTDEQLVKELEKELQDETIFKTKVDVLREEYKKLEDQYNENQQAEFEKQREEEYEQFSDTMVNIALQTPEFYGIELEDNEKNEVLSFLLDLDENGTSEFYKTLNDPKKMYEAAWFLRYGKESFDALKNAYESEIIKLKQKDKQGVIKRIDDPSRQTNSIHDLNF